MVLHVIDDGVGFPNELKPQQGLGYHIMKYRAQLTGGRLEIDSPQTGAHVCPAIYRFMRRGRVKRQMAIRRQKASKKIQTP